jgi:excinuclease ABC subunit A
MAGTPARSIPLNVPWKELSELSAGHPGRWPGRKHWYGVKGYFEYLERKAYKMHVRVLLSRYRSYTECTACHGAR